MRGDGTLRALAFTSCLEPIRSINRRHSSYGKKHVAERLTFSLPGDVIVPPRYVSNGQLIAAAIHAGFKLHAPERNGDGTLNTSPNPIFNMSERSWSLSAPR